MATLHDLSQLPATLSLLSSPVVRGRARVRRPGRAEQGEGEGEGDSIALLESDREAGEARGDTEGDQERDTSEQQDSDKTAQPAPAAAPSPGRWGRRSGSEARLRRRLAGGRDTGDKEVGSVQCVMEARDRRGNLCVQNPPCEDGKFMSI